MRFSGWDWVAPVVAAVGFAGAVVVFAVERTAFREAVIGWTRHDLAERTELAAVTLREPLKTGDFARIHAFGEACAADGIRLTVTSAAGGLVFDSLRQGAEIPEAVYESRPSGEWQVRLGMPLDRVLAPVTRAGFGFLLAALAGGAGMLLVFFSTYRQRVRFKELARLERFRRDFIADFSHELKTPLTGLLGAVDLLAPHDVLQERLVPLVRNEAQRLNRLAESMLDLARLERTPETAQRTAFNAADLVREVVGRFRLEAEAAGLTLTAVLPDVAASRVCRSNPDLLTQALANLVSNAIRHAGGTTIRVAAEARKDAWRFSVTDDGVGIPASARARIFERFYRVESSRTTPGTGLGLAIVRGIARLHGGTVVCSAVEPHGSCFTLTIPQ